MRPFLGARFMIVPELSRLLLFPPCIAITEQKAYSYSYGEIKIDGKVVPITMVYMIANEGAFLDFNKAYSLDTIWTPNIEDDKYLWRGVVVYSRKAFTLETTAEGRSYAPMFLVPSCAILLWMSRRSCSVTQNSMRIGLVRSAIGYSPPSNYNGHFKRETWYPLRKKSLSLYNGHFLREKQGSA